MSRIHVETEKVLDAQPEKVYEVLSDYQGKRQQILTPNFLNYTVEKGGRGSGTVVRYRLQAARRERPYHISIDEPEQGRVIREKDADSSLVTLWTVLPEQSNQRTRVRVITEWEGGRGIGGFFERTFAPLGLRGIYRNMLSSLAQQVEPAQNGTGTEKGTGNNVLPVALVAVGVAAAVGIGVWRWYQQQA